MIFPSPIAWTPSRGIRLLDQTRLPEEEVYLAVEDVGVLAEAIRSLRVRGAPLIGIAGAMGVAGAVVRLAGSASKAGREAVLETVADAVRILRGTRPTAVNLGWALDRMAARVEAAVGADPGDLADLAVSEAQAIWDEDRAMCRRIGEAGAALLPDDATVLTHCNAGALATGGIGTALAPVYVAHESGRRVQVVADETRPLLQGSRLTAWELTRAGVPCTVIADSMAASRLGRGDIACVLVGADRIARNGDVANKIGTYGLALAARAHDVPFYVAAPRSTIDLAAPNGAAIPLEERAPDEVTVILGRRAVPVGVGAWNPAFDVTPADLVSAFITDAGIVAASDLARRFGDRPHT